MRVGQPFPFWRGATQLNLRVSAAVPADLVRLVAGSEVAVAPRPRQRPSALRACALKADNEQTAEGTEEGNTGPVWLRVQVCSAGGSDVHPTQRILVNLSLLA